MLAANEGCPTTEVNEFLKHIGVAGGTGRYAVRKQVLRDNQLYIATEDFDDKDKANDYFLKVIEGSLYSVLVGPEGEILASDGCPKKTSDVAKKRTWIWWVVGGLILAAAVAGTVFYIRRRRQTASE